MRLGPDEATAIIQAAATHAVATGLRPLSVVVLGADEAVRAALSQEGATPLRFEIARAKASGALQMGVNSRALEELAAQRPGFFSSLVQLAGGRMVAAAGGVLVLDEEGRVMGAVGISGDTSDNDEACALAAVERAGLIARQ